MLARASASGAGLLLLGHVGFAILQAMASIVVARALHPDQRGDLAFVVVTGVLASQMFERGGEYGAMQLRQYGTGMAELLSARSLLVAEALAATVSVSVVYFRTDSALMSLGAGVLAATGIASKSLLGGLIVEHRSWLVVFVRLWPSAVLLAGAAAYVLLDLNGLGPILLALCVGHASALPLTLTARVMIHRPAAEAQADSAPSGVDLMRLHAGNTGVYALYRCDQFLLGLFGFRAQLGLYAVAVNIAEITQYIPSVATTLLIRDGNGRQRLRRLTFVATMAVAAILAVSSHWVIVQLYGRAYAQATRYIPLLLLAYLVFSVARLEWGDLIREEAYRAFMIASLIAAGLGLPIISAMIRGAGAMGAAWASLITYCMLSVALAAAHRRITPSIDGPDTR